MLKTDMPPAEMHSLELVANHDWYKRGSPVDLRGRTDIGRMYIRYTPDFMIPALHVMNKIGFIKYDTIIARSDFIVVPKHLNDAVYLGAFEGYPVIDPKARFLTTRDFSKAFELYDLDFEKNRWPTYSELKEMKNA
jgi:hypothetical protein